MIFHHHHRRHQQRTAGIATAQINQLDNYLGVDTNSMCYNQVSHDVCICHLSFFLSCAAAVCTCLDQRLCWYCAQYGSVSGTCATTVAYYLPPYKRGTPTVPTLIA
jgi:hypothetical protein